MIHKTTAKEEVLKLAPACQCTKCEHGCKFGSGAFANEEEIEKAAKFKGVKTEEFKKKYLEEIEKFNTSLLRPKIKGGSKQYGTCVFFDTAKGCGIHEVKPLECKTAMGCAPHAEELSLWFTLNHFLDGNDPESIRQFVTYLKSGGKTLAGASLQELIPDQKQLQRIVNFEVLK